MRVASEGPDSPTGSPLTVDPSPGSCRVSACLALRKASACFCQALQTDLAAGWL